MIKTQKGFSLLEQLLALSISGGVAAHVFLTADQVEQAIQIHNEKACNDALKLVHDFPQLQLSPEYMERCQ